jgi:2-polyprenyl-6-hydroxyphenyl methylase/3-demethylubiquinone-9 3-methyltransferase
MGIGPCVRRLLGRFERPAAELYRSVFVDLDSFVASIRNEVDTPPRILEIGCGEGCVIERLAHTFRDASITGIDISAQPGRLCTVKEPRIRFLETTAAQMAAAEPASYPLVIIGDVLHHVPRTEREGLLQHAAMLLAPGGVLIFKEWVRQRTLAYLMGYCADRFITGDQVHYMREEELKNLATGVFGATSIRSQFRVPPWNCNLALVIVPLGR